MRECRLSDGSRLANRRGRGARSGDGLRCGSGFRCFSPGLEIENPAGPPEAGSWFFSPVRGSSSESGGANSGPNRAGGGANSGPWPGDVPRGSASGVARVPGSVADRGDGSIPSSRDQARLMRTCAPQRLSAHWSASSGISHPHGDQFLPRLLDPSQADAEGVGDPRRLDPSRGRGICRPLR